LLRREKRLSKPEKRKVIEDFINKSWAGSFYRKQTKPQDTLWRVTNDGIKASAFKTKEHPEHMLKPVAIFIRDYGGHFDWEVSYWLGLPLVTSQHALEILSGKPLSGKEQACPYMKGCKLSFKPPAIESVPMPISTLEKSKYSVDVLRYRCELEEKDGKKVITLLNGENIDVLPNTFSYNGKNVHYTKAVSVMRDSWRGYVDYALRKSE